MLDRSNKMRKSEGNPRVGVVFAQPLGQRMDNVGQSKHGGVGSVHDMEGAEIRGAEYG